MPRGRLCLHRLPGRRRLGHLQRSQPGSAGGIRGPGRWALTPSTPPAAWCSPWPSARRWPGRSRRFATPAGGDLARARGGGRPGRWRCAVGGWSGLGRPDPTSAACEQSTGSLPALGAEQRRRFWLGARPAVIPALRGLGGARAGRRGSQSAGRPPRGGEPDRLSGQRGGLGDRPRLAGADDPGRSGGRAIEPRASVDTTWWPRWSATSGLTGRSLTRPTGPHSPSWPCGPRGPRRRARPPAG